MEASQQTGPRTIDSVIYMPKNAQQREVLRDKRRVRWVGVRLRG